MIDTNLRQLQVFLLARTFVLLDFFGIAISSLAFLSNDVTARSIILTIGSTIFTLGITLPVALYYQTRQSSESFKILKTCDSAGIVSIFVSRKKDSQDLRNAIDEAARLTSDEIDLLGIAFPNFLNPNESHTQNVEDKLHDPKIKMRILLLDPLSKATERRSEIEIGSATKRDIEDTLNFSIVSHVQSRLQKLCAEQRSGRFVKLIESFKNSTAISPNDMQWLTEQINLQVKLYDQDPILFMMKFAQSAFIEQYHFGRPAGHVPPKGCIGKYVPVVQYKKGSTGYTFFDSHFEYLWKTGSDYTSKVIQASVENHSLRKSNTQIVT